jgi:histidinol-phosphate phosphatase family protein
VSPSHRVVVSQWPERQSEVMKSATIGGAEKRPAVFLDRDGTIINDIGYLADPEGISFFPDVPEVLKRLQDRGYLLVVITNQSGIGRGYFNEETALSVNLTMVRLLKKKGVALAAIYYCPHDPEDNCRCRKPELLMVHRAQRDLDIDLIRSWVVGDIDKDVRTGLKAGVRPILVETGKAEKGNVPADVKRSETVVEAVRFILEKGL